MNSIAWLLLGITVQANAPLVRSSAGYRVIATPSRSGEATIRLEGAGLDLVLISRDGKPSREAPKLSLVWERKHRVTPVDLAVSRRGHVAAFGTGESDALVLIGLDGVEVGRHARTELTGRSAVSGRNTGGRWFRHAAFITVPQEEFPNAHPKQGSALWEGTVFRVGIEVLRLSLPDGTHQWFDPGTGKRLDRRIG